MIKLTNMNIRKTDIKDLDIVLSIYSHARIEMKKNNNPNQWKDDHPLVNDIINDINNGIHYSIFDSDEIVGVFTLLEERDPTYSYIEGKWLNDDQYVTIHKIASNNKVKGILKAAIDFGFNKVNNVRIDTHSDNMIMQHLLDKYGFSRCGIIYLLNGEPRIAYQKEVKR